MLAFCAIDVCVFVIVFVYACSFIYVKGTQNVTYNLGHILDSILCVYGCVCVCECAFVFVFVCM